jgi:CRISPR-associated endonuclease/helicase Cas3
LSHGKSVVNAEYTGLERWHATEVGVDCCGDLHSPSQWFSGRKRILLSPHVVGTIDNLLIAGAQIKHVALHHLAFAQKVVVLDEVHAADIYMSQFLQRALAWLGASQVSVVLLSATLPASMRQRLIRAYTGQTVDVGNEYPQITTADAVAVTTYTAPATAAKKIRLEVLDEPALDGRDTINADNHVADLLKEQLSEGGCALVIRNTVARAQHLYSALKASLPADRVLLLHSRFTAGDRAGHADQLLGLLGDTSKGAQRPRCPQRLVVVATQVAEQSLDIDADLLITDLCPIDLLLQRAGRLHRHAANNPLRPARLQKPTVVITRMRGAHAAATDSHLGLPASLKGFVYPAALLARTAQILFRTTSLVLPDDVPAVITEVYEDEHYRCDNPMWHTALTRWDSDRSWEDEKLRIQALNAALKPPEELTDVHGLNRYEQDAERVMVRSGDIPLEICLLQRDPDGLLHGVGSDITFQPDGTVIDSMTDADVGGRVIASAVRISNKDSSKDLVAALCDKPPLTQWKEHPWLRNTGVLVLDVNAAAAVPTDRGDFRLTYSHELGLSWNT